MRLQQLRYFLAVAKSRNVSRAAETLFVSQPALSKQIALLEKDLRFPLFERTPRGVELTEKGTAFYEKISPLVQEMDHVFNDMTEPTELSIGMLPSIASHYFPSVSVQLHAYKLNPVIKNTSEELLEMVQAGELDAAVVQDRDSYRSLKHLHLFDESYLAAISSTHPLAKQESVRLDDLMKEKLILFKPPCDITERMIEIFEETGEQVDITFEETITDALLIYTAMGAGISFVPAMKADNVTYKQIVYKKIDHDACKRSIDLFSRLPLVIDLFSTEHKGAC